MAAIREAFEEAGADIPSDTAYTKLGDMVANTTFMAQYIEVYLIQVDSSRLRSIDPDAYESFIGAAKWLSVEEIWERIDDNENPERKDPMFDAISMAVIGQYFMKQHFEAVQAQSALAAQA